MKNFKKNWIALLLCLIAAALSVCFAGCSKKSVDANEERVAITVTQATEGETLVQYMEGLQKNGELTFIIEKGMITSINDIAQANNCYWMLYTSDSENANTAWGTYEHNGQTLGSAIYGAESLTIKNDCVYVWVYTKF